MYSYKFSMISVIIIYTRNVLIKSDWEKIKQSHLIVCVHGLKPDREESLMHLRLLVV